MSTGISRVLPSRAFVAFRRPALRHRSVLKRRILAFHTEPPPSFSLEAEEGVDSPQFYQQFDSLLEKSQLQVVPGQKVEGRVVEVDDSGVYVDFRGKEIGFCTSSEITLQPVSKPSQLLPLDSVHDFEVIEAGLKSRIRGGDYTALSRSDIVRSTLDKRLRLMHELQIKVTVEVLQKNRGGYVVMDEYGVEGFLPGRQSAVNPSLSSITDDPLLGQEITVRILDVQEQEGTIVFSQRGVLDDGPDESQFKMGSVMEGVVEGVKAYGVFVTVNGVAGLLHITQISQARVPDLNEMFKTHDRIKVMILSYDKLRGRLSLSTRRLEMKVGDMINNREEVYRKAEETAAKLKQKDKRTGQKPIDDDIMSIGPNVSVRKAPISS